MAAPPSSSAARMISDVPVVAQFMKACSTLRIRVHEIQTVGSDLLQYRKAGAHYQQRQEDRESERHAQSAVVLEEERDGQCDGGDHQQSACRVQRHLLLQRVVLG